jgi:uncharacterized protein (DUF2141 family)
MRKSFSVSSLLAALSLLTVSALASAHELQLKIDKIKNTKGVMLVALHNVAADYEANNSALVAKKLPLTGNELVIDFGDLPEGRYAIKIFQDENENGEIDKSFMGVPIEGYGFSNNGGAFGPVSFEDASFVLDKKQQQVIHLR